MYTRSLWPHGLKAWFKLAGEATGFTNPGDIDPMDRRHPIRQFEPGLVERHLEGRNIQSVELLPYGKSNSNYKLAIDGEACVLRLHAGGNAERERTAMRLAENVVPVPKLLDSGDDWTLLAFVEGDDLADHPECLRCAAEVAARIWTITFEGRGWINADGSVMPFDFGGEDDFTVAMLKHPDVQRWLAQDDVRALAAILGREADRPNDIQMGGCLVHGDFNPSNILVRDGAVVAVLDWEFAHSGDPFMDISNLVRHTPEAFHDDIRDGLQSSGVILPDDWLARCEFDHLGSYLEFLTTRRSDEFKRHCAVWIRAFIGRHA